MLPPTAPSARRSAANWKRASKNSALRPSTNGAPSRRRFPPPNRMARENPSAPDEHGRSPHFVRKNSLVTSAQLDPGRAASRSSAGRPPSAATAPGKRRQQILRRTPRSEEH